MVKHTLNILQQMLLDCQRVFGHFGALDVTRLTDDGNTLKTQRHIQDPVEHPRGFQPLTIFTKSSILDVRLGSQYASETFCVRVYFKCFPFTAEANMLVFLSHENL